MVELTGDGLRQSSGQRRDNWRRTCRMPSRSHCPEPAERLRGLPPPGTRDRRLLRRAILRVRAAGGPKAASERIPGPKCRGRRARMVARRESGRIRSELRPMAETFEMAPVDVGRLRPGLNAQVSGRRHQPGVGLPLPRRASAGRYARLPMDVVDSLPTRVVQSFAGLNNPFTVGNSSAARPSSLSARAPASTPSRLVESSSAVSSPTADE